MKLELKLGEHFEFRLVVSAALVVMVVRVLQTLLGG